MTIFDIALIPFPFSDLSSTKKRPCLIIGEFSPRSLGKHYVICMITSKIHGIKFPFDVVIGNIKSAGLPKDSIIRLTKVVTIEEKLIIKKLGKLAVGDIAAVKKSFGGFYEKILGR